MSQNVRSTVDAASQSVSEAENQPAESTQKPTEAQTAYILVPVDKDKYMMQNPSDNGIPTNSPQVNIQ